MAVEGTGPAAPESNSPIAAASSTPSTSTIISSTTPSTIPTQTPIQVSTPYGSADPGQYNSTLSPNSHICTQTCQIAVPTVLVSVVGIALLLLLAWYMQRCRKPSHEKSNIPECCKHLDFRGMLKRWFFRDRSFSDLKAQEERDTSQKNPRKSGYWDLESGPPTIPLSSQRQAGEQANPTAAKNDTARRASVSMEAERRGIEEERRVSGSALAGETEEEESEERKREVEAMRRVRGRVKALPFWLGGWTGGS